MKRVLAIVTLSIALGAAACGDDGDGFGQSLDRDDPSTQEPSGFGEPTNDDDGETGSDGPLLRCVDPPPTELGIGESTQGSVASQTSAPCFWVDIPDGLDSISFELAGVGADVGLSVGYGFLTRVQFPGLGEFWTEEQPGADEIITISNPKPGPYFVTIGVVGFQSEADFTFTVTAAPATTTEPSGASPPTGRECAAPAVTLEFGGSASGEITGRDERPDATDYYCVEIPGGIPAATVTASDLTDRLEVIVLRPDGPVWRDAGGPDDDAVAVIDEAEPGVYIIDIVIGAGRTASYTVAVQPG